MNVTDHKYLIIAGAPKAGTSSLYKYLSDHPEICSSSIKETRFFLDKEDILPFINKYDGGNLDLYDNFFKHCNNKNKIRMEATPDYLYSESALKVNELLPNCKLVFIFRDPIERLVSWFKFAKQRGFLDNSVTFDDYVSMQIDLDITPSTPVHLRALKQGKYKEYLARFKKRMKNKVLVISFDDLCNSPNTVMQNISEFSGIGENFYADYSFTIENKSVSVKYQTIEKFYLNVRDIITSLVYRNQILIKILRIPNQLIKKILLRNQQPAITVHMSKETQKFLRKYYNIRPT